MIFNNKRKLKLPGLSSFWKNRELIIQLTKREVFARYKGSYLGIIWSIINPIIMLIVYTFVFSVMFNARWGLSSSNKTEFALVLFCGLITFTLFSEVISRSPGLILSNVNYVKKVVFPLEILPIVILSAAIINMLIGLVILLAGLIIFMGILHWTIIFIPLVLLPLILLSIGLGWILSSIGVFLRDINHFIGAVIQILMFLSPVFYPITNVPIELRPIFYFNPLSYVVEDMRRVVIWGQLPDWEWLFFGTVIGLLFSFFGYYWFQKTRGGFADVL